jgi:hypothetical protein
VFLLAWAAGARPGVQVTAHAWRESEATDEASWRWLVEAKEQSRTSAPEQSSRHVDPCSDRCARFMSFCLRNGEGSGEDNNRAREHNVEHRLWQIVVIGQVDTQWPWASHHLASRNRRIALVHLASQAP